MITTQTTGGFAAFTISETKKEKGIYCCAYGCTNEPVYRKGMLCHKHYARKLRKTSPIEVRYNQFKQKSKQRNIVNTVTLEQFKWFCNKTKYLIQKGKRGMNATIDRRCNVHGYHIWNMQILSQRHNCMKGTKMSADCPF